MKKIDGVSVSIKDLAPRIHDYGMTLAADYDPEEITEEDGDPGGDIRLQVVDGSWELHEGDACYDTDHRGWWGDEFVPAGCSKAEAREIAYSLIEGAYDHFWGSVAQLL